MCCCSCGGCVCVRGFVGVLVVWFCLQRCLVCFAIVRFGYLLDFVFAVAYCWFCFIVVLLLQFAGGVGWLGLRVSCDLISVFGDLVLIVCGVLVVWFCCGCGVCNCLRWA